MKGRFSRWTKRPPCPTDVVPILKISEKRLLQQRIYLKKSDWRKRRFLEKAVSALRCKGRTASIAFVSTNADFHHKGTLALMTKMLVVVRVSGGHLCEAEAPTEATAETFPNPLKSAILPRIKS